jgi:hypothetical protein
MSEQNRTAPRRLFPAPSNQENRSMRCAKPYSKCPATGLVIALILAMPTPTVFADDTAHPTPNLDLPASTAPNNIALPGVTVKRSTDPLSRSDRHLARLKKSLPGTATPAIPGNVDKVKNYLAAHSDPNATTGEQRKMMRDTSGSPPEAIPGIDTGKSP